MLQRSRAAARRLPVPTCDDLMSAGAGGQPACAVWRDRFASWPLDDAVTQVVMNALDPLLLQAVLGPAESARWLPLLREHYVQVQACYPAEFSDVETSWAGQREWWLQFVEQVDEAADPSPASSGGGSAPAPDSSDARQRPSSRERRRPGRSAAATAPAPSAAQPSRARARPLPPPTSTAAAPSAAGAAVPPLVSDEPDAVLDAVPVSPAPAKAAPVRPPAAARPGAPASGRPGSTAVRPRSPARVRAQAVTAAAPSVTPLDEPPRVAATGRAGRATLGARGRRLVEAASVSYDAVRALTREWAASDAPQTEWSDWAIGSGIFEQRLRARERAGPAR